MLSIVSALVVSLSGAGALVAPAGIGQLEGWLAEMHPDYRTYIGDVRLSRAVAPNVYMGLVRPGGDDPRQPRDAPLPGAGGRYDLIVFQAGDEAWSRLLLDHEYFHARRLAHSDPLPHPVFGRAAADAHLQEALAWGYNLDRAGAGAYGSLPPEHLEEARRRYRIHRDAVQRFVARQGPASWPYYAGLLPPREPKAEPRASVPSR